MRIFVTIIISILSLSNALAQDPDPRYIQSKDAAIMINATIETEPAPQVTLNWNATDLCVQIEISRKAVDTDSWKVLRNLDGAETSFVDDGIEAGEAYEYRIQGIYQASAIWRVRLGDTSIVDTTMPNNFLATGYAYVGVESEENHTFGKILILVDETIAAPLAMEIERLENDLIAEGWSVVKKEVPRHEEFDSAAVKNTKRIILDEYDKDDNLSAVLLLGRVVVPYSGCIYPDGHTNHFGAWPADVYYGDMDDSRWTDRTDYETNGKRPVQENVADDGKFDQSIVPGSIELMVGRVDFYNMPQFEESEIELLRRYLDKNHDYRTGEFYAERRGLIDDNFGARRYMQCFASCGYRHFGSFFGFDAVKKLDWFGTLQTDSYLWAYGCGGGVKNQQDGSSEFANSAGVGSTVDFSTKPSKAVFQCLLASYSGDWDSENNLMRAMIASEPYGLTCAWSGFPHWYFHHMDLGFPIGYSARLTQSNYDTYMGSSYQSGQSFVLMGQGLKNIHVALMGDPTLTMYGSDVAEPKNLQVVQPLGKPVELAWEAPAIDDIYHFNIYRAPVQEDGTLGKFEKMNSEPVFGTEFVDEELYEGELVYLVRTVQLKTNNSGSHYAMSRGVFQNVVATDVPEGAKFAFDVSCAPNPAIEFANISLELAAPANVHAQIFDASGRLIKTANEGWLSSGGHRFVWNLENVDGAKVRPGVYYAKILAGNSFVVQKIVVI